MERWLVRRGYPREQGFAFRVKIALHIGRIEDAWHGVTSRRALRFIDEIRDDRTRDLQPKNAPGCLESTRGIVALGDET
jgi:hypothetical protein